MKASDKESGNKSQPLDYIPTLNGWRAFSIIYVVLYHALWYFFHPRTGDIPNAEYWRWISIGSFGVYFFFGISGFLITTRLLQERKRSQECGQPGRISLSSFYLRRAFRILPVVFCYLSVLWILKRLGVIEVSDLNLIGSLFFFRNYIPDDWYTMHFWSLSLEEHYYLFWPAFFVLLLHFKRAWQGILILIAAVTLWRSIEYRMNILGPFLPISHFRGRTDLFMDYILWGSFFAVFYSFKAVTQKMDQYLRPWMLFPVFAFMHFLILKAVPFSDTLKAICIQICILLTVHFPKSWASQILEFRLFAKIGIYSYSIYVWQQLFLTPKDYQVFANIQSFPLNMALVGLIALISYHAVEAPAIRYGRSLIKRFRLR